MNMLGFDLYLRSTDKDGRVTFTEHRVWDADRFIAARQADTEKVGGQSSAKQVTREEYLAAQPRRARA